MSIKNLIILAILVLASVLALAQDNNKQLTPQQKTTIENANQQAVVSQYLARIAELERQVASLQVRVTIAEACADADVKLSECEVKQDGTISRKTATPTPTSKPGPAPVPGSK